MKILFHDVDGCLNVDGKTPIPIGGERLSSNQSAKLKELGRKLDSSSIDHLVINTGRSIEETLPLVEAISSNKLQFIIAEHGAVYRDVKNGKFVIPQGSIATKLEFIDSFIGWYREVGAKILRERVGIDIPVLQKVANLTLDVRNVRDSQKIYEALQEVVRSDAPFDCEQLVFHHSKADGYIDAMSQVDKGDGIRVVASLLSQAQNPTESNCSIAIGNGLNDMPMLEVATIAVCPGNAELEVREYCYSQSGIVSEYEYIDATLHWLDKYI